MSKCCTRIVCGLEFQPAELAWMNEVVGCDDKLESLSNNFFNKFAKSVQKNNGVKCFWIVVQCLVWFGNDDCCGNLEVFRPMAQFDASISYVDDLGKAIIVLDDKFPVMP